MKRRRLTGSDALGLINELSVSISDEIAVLTTHEDALLATAHRGLAVKNLETVTTDGTTMAGASIFVIIAGEKYAIPANASATGITTLPTVSVTPAGEQLMRVNVKGVPKTSPRYVAAASGTPTLTFTWQYYDYGYEDANGVPFTKDERWYPKTTPRFDDNGWRPFSTGKVTYLTHDVNPLVAEASVSELVIDKADIKQKTALFFRCKVTNLAGSAVSNVVRLNIRHN
jgi:hypothetical protein